jgi:hypothetical protein
VRPPKANSQEERAIGMLKLLKFIDCFSGYSAILIISVRYIGFLVVRTPMGFLIDIML